MSYGDKPALSASQKIGCAVYVVAVYPLIYLGFFAGILGFWEEASLPIWQKLLGFVVLTILPFVGGILLLRFFMRDNN